jgi:hypothetical protein
MQNEEKGRNGAKEHPTSNIQHPTSNIQHPTSKPGAGNSGACGCLDNFLKILTRIWSDLVELSRSRSAARMILAEVAALTRPMLLWSRFHIPICPPFAGLVIT